MDSCLQVKGFIVVLARLVEVHAVTALLRNGLGVVGARPLLGWQCPLWWDSRTTLSVGHIGYKGRQPCIAGWKKSTKATLST